MGFHQVYTMLREEAIISNNLGFSMGALVLVRCYSCQRIESSFLF